MGFGAEKNIGSLGKEIQALAQCIPWIRALRSNSNYCKMKVIFIIIEFCVLMENFVAVCLIRSNLNSSDSQNKTTIGQKKQISVLAFHSEPYFYEDKKQEAKGIEFEPLKTISEKLNLTFSFQNETDHNGTELMIGGLSIGYDFQDLKNSSVFSISYFQDDLMWCVRNAGYFPTYLNVFMLAKPECWIIIIFGVGYSCGYILFIFIQFDRKYNHRNQRDWHYTTWLIALPSIIGINQRFQPIYGPLRLFYGLMLFIGQIIGIFLFTFGLSRLQDPLLKYQVSTQSKLLDDNYQLFGSRVCYEAIRFDGRVNYSNLLLFFRL